MNNFKYICLLLLLIVLLIPIIVNTQNIVKPINIPSVEKKMFNDSSIKIDFPLVGDISKYNLKKFDSGVYQTISDGFARARCVTDMKNDSNGVGWLVENDCHIVVLSSNDLRLFLTFIEYLRKLDNVLEYDVKKVYDRQGNFVAVAESSFVFPTKVKVFQHTRFFINDNGVVGEIRNK